MEDNIKKIEQFFNDFIVENKFDKSLIYHNLVLFYNVSIMIENILVIFSEEKVDDLDFSNVTKFSLFEKMNLIKDFYNKLNINFDIDKYINDGTIEFLFSNDDNIDNYLTGINYYHNKRKLIDVCENGVITDAAIQIHELSHLRNQPECRRNEINDLLTESIAYAEEFMFMDYLKELGFDEDCYLLKKQIFSFLYNNTTKLRVLYKMLYLYKTLGNISIDSYKMIYGNEEEYNDIINYILKLIDNNRFKLHYDSWYLFVPLLSSYMYQQYKKDNNYINNINLLHERINDSDMLTCLKIIGLNDFGEEDRNILVDCLKETISFYKKEEKTLHLK